MRITRSQGIYLLKLIVTITALYWLFQHFHLGETLWRMRSADPAYFLTGLAVMLAAHILNAHQLRCLAAPYNLSLGLGDLFRINMIAKLYSLILPGVVGGGLVRWYYLSRPDGKRAQAAAIILFNRLLELAGLALTAVIFWVWDSRAQGGLELLEASSFVLLAVGMGYFLLFHPASHAFLRRATRHLPWPRALRSRLAKLALALSLYHGQSPAFHGKLLLLSLARQLLVSSCVWTFALGLGMSLDFATIAWIRALLSIVLTLPVTIGGLGIREAGYAYLLEPYEIAPEAALALSLLIFVRMFLFSLCGAIFQLQFKPHKPSSV